MNVRGTREMLQLAGECRQLSLFCHLSTAFCHLDEKVLHERSYDAPADPRTMIELAEQCSEEEVEAKLKQFLGRDIPNSYIFTKALTEAMIVGENEKLQLPIVICRPAVVTSSYCNPIAGSLKVFLMGFLWILEGFYCTFKNLF
jgi:fatty acyl-CoA reductase